MYVIVVTTTSGIMIYGNRFGSPYRTKEQAEAAAGYWKTGFVPGAIQSVEVQYIREHAGNRPDNS